MKSWKQSGWELWDQTRHWFAKVPLIGPIAYCRWPDHRASLKEMFVVTLFGTATFWLTAVLLLGPSQTRSLGYLSLLESTVRGGELFIFTVGFIGPILLTAAEDPKDARSFPGRLWHILALVIVGFVATGYHAQIKAALLGGAMSEDDSDFFFSVSLGIAFVAVVLRYLAILYRKSTFEPEVEIKLPEAAFVDEYEQHLGKEGQ